MRTLGTTRERLCKSLPDGMSEWEALCSCFVPFTELECGGHCLCFELKLLDSFGTRWQASEKKSLYGEYSKNWSSISMIHENKAGDGDVHKPRALCAQVSAAPYFQCSSHGCFTRCVFCAWTLNARVPLHVMVNKHASTQLLHWNAWNN